MAGERGLELAGAPVPQLHLLVEGGGGEVAAVGGELQVVDRLLVAGEPGHGALALPAAPAPAVLP
eukprot:CAMPEP_0194560848 /NCGR_PEP_ID=MMETSP0292-20121207/1861_1 /TAXON_ID=39354 /ORGANISM="Heterosigma akashiwo, Strain CCMP2393" /LENGTH=64 /DNA_ID=CAMNT_0039409103 /DNA_START=262 /DNA_END=456 /DNA_ORIENTATION=+